MLTISVQNTNGNVKFSCLDEDLAINDLVGEASVKLSTILQSSVKRHSFPLLYKGKQSGELFIETKFIPAIVVEEQSEELEYSMQQQQQQSVSKLPRISRNYIDSFAQSDP